MPTTFAYLAMFAWPIVVFVLYRRLPRANALIASILGGYLLLPYHVGINPPVLPTYDKTLAPALAALVMSLLMRPVADRAIARPVQPGQESFTRKREAVPIRAGTRATPRRETPQRLRQSLIGNALLLLLVVTPFLTVMQNGESLIYGPRVLPGLRPYDAFSMILSSLVAILPYLLARRYLATPAAHRLLLCGLVFWGLVYTVPSLYEIRMSPQLARSIYGFLAQSFVQAIRDGGFRPVVFLQGGLWLAIFFSMTILAAAALWRVIRQEQDSRNAAGWMLALLWLLLVLLLCHSLGAVVILVALLPAVLFMPVRGQLLLASVVSATVLTYPALRGADLVPVHEAVALAESISGARAQSLEFRLKNEDQLLEIAREKPLTGWGGWGRSFFYDPRTGRDLSVTDGAWIIIVGVSGWLGYIAKFGLLTAPIFLLTLRRRKLGVDLATSGLALVVVANLCDMIPNATLTPLTWLAAGALMGRVALGGETELPKEPARTSRRAPPTRLRAVRTLRALHRAR